MTLAEIVFEKRKLEKRYGPEGKAAGRYVEAGYSVKMYVETPAGRLSFVARKGGEAFAAKVFNGSVVVKAEDVREVARMAEYVKARPLIVLYGAGPKLAPEAIEEAKKSNAAIKRIR